METMSICAMTTIGVLGRGSRISMSPNRGSGGAPSVSGSGYTPPPGNGTAPLLTDERINKGRDAARYLDSITEGIAYERQLDWLLLHEKSPLDRVTLVPGDPPQPKRWSRSKGHLGRFAEKLARASDDDVKRVLAAKAGAVAKLCEGSEYKGSQLRKFFKLRPKMLENLELRGRDELTAHVDDLIGSMLLQERDETIMQFARKYHDEVDQSRSPAHLAWLLENAYDSPLRATSFEQIRSPNRNDLRMIAGFLRELTRFADYDWADLCLERIRRRGRTEDIEGFRGAIPLMVPFIPRNMDLIDGLIQTHYDSQGSLPTLDLVREIIERKKIAQPENQESVASKLIGVIEHGGERVPSSAIVALGILVKNLGASKRDIIERTIAILEPLSKRADVNECLDKLRKTLRYASRP